MKLYVWWLIRATYGVNRLYLGDFLAGGGDSIHVQYTFMYSYLP